MYFVGKPIYLSKEKYREYYFAKWDKDLIAAGTSEERFKKFKYIQVFQFYFGLFLLVLILFTAEVVYFFLKMLEVIVSIYHTIF
jgi:hypothetical protein